MSFLERLLKYRWTLSLLLAAVFPLTMFGAVEAFRGISNRIQDWMPDDFEPTLEFYRFFDLFGSDELLMISWEGCTFDDPRIAPFRTALLEPVDTGEGPQPLFREVITGPEVLDYFLSPPLSMTRDEAVERMGGWVVSPSGRQTCMIALVAHPEKVDRHAAVAHVRAAASGVPGLSVADVHMAGTTMESVAIDEASQSNLLTLNFASFSLCMLIMAVCLRNLRAALIVLLIALFNEQLSMALIYFCGSQMNSILLLTANLTFVLTISVCVHLVNYYRDALQNSSPEEAPLKACRAALQPTLLATLTTSLGLISLTASQIKPIVRFGAYSAASVVAATGIALVYTTLHFRIWPLRPVANAAGRGAGDNRWPALDGWVRVVGALRWPVIAITVTAFVVGCFGVTRLTTSVGLHDLLSPRTAAVRDYQWLERNIGPLTPVEIVLQMPSGDARALLSQFRAVAGLQAALAAAFPDYAVISSGTFAPDPPPRAGGLRQIARAAVFRRKLMESQESLSELGYLRVEPDRNHWRITMRCPAMADMDYGELLERINAIIESTVGGGGDVEPQDVIVCGGVPLVYQAQQQLLDDLIQSYLLAFVLVCLTLMMLFRSVWCGLICMVPNILPSAVVFGWMGWRGSPIEIGAILTASAALGIAVDDSLHFITWFRRKIGDGGSVIQAVQYAYRRCAAAMVQTTFICSFGLLVFALSPFAPISRFGWCMFALLMMALVADLLVLPAILLSPLGHPFLPRDPAMAPRTLRGFAWRVAAPRELLLSLIANAIIAVWVFHATHQVSLVEGLARYLVPACFLLPAWTTFFGIFRAVNERRSGRVEPPWPPGAQWRGTAVLAGLVSGCGCGLASLAGFYLLGRITPEIMVSKWVVIVAVGLSAGLLGYVLHGLSVMATGRLPRRPPNNDRQ